MRLKGLRRCAGFTVVELLLVMTLVTSVPTGAYLHAKSKAMEINCQNNLRQIYMALEMFVMSNGVFPEAVFYPEKPTKDKDSIRVILKPYGATAGVFVDPVAPAKLKKLGLTYVWNDELSGKRPESIPDRGKKWLMMDICAVTKKVPASHRGGYNILYADGQVAWSKQAPAIMPRKD